MKLFLERVGQWVRLVVRPAFIVGRIIRDSFWIGRLRQADARWFDIPAINTFINFLLLLAGVLLGLSPGFQVVGHLGSRLIGAALAAMWVLLFVAREAALKTLQDRERRDLKSSIITKAPVTFSFEEAKETLTDIARAVQAVSGESAIEATRETILFGLRAVRKLAAAFSGIEEARVGINVMTAHLVSSLPTNDPLLSAVRFHGRFKLNPNDYVLWLRTELMLPSNQSGEPPSTPTTPANPTTPFVLHSLAPTASTPAMTRFPVLPGAPLAYWSGVTSVFSDAKEMGKFARDHCEFTPEINQQIEKYFREEGTDYVSVASFRIGIREPYPGVLNIDSSERNILGDRELHHTISCLVTAALVHLEPVVARYLTQSMEIAGRREGTNE